MSYLLILMVLLVCMALLDARWTLFLFAKPLPAAAVLLLGTIFFLVWDVSAIGAGIFLHRESPLMTGIMLGAQLPLEEVFFLLFLCYQAMILFTGVLRILRHLRLLRRDRQASAGGRP